MKRRVGTGSRNNQKTECNPPDFIPAKGHGSRKQASPKTEEPADICIHQQGERRNYQVKQLQPHPTSSNIIQHHPTPSNIIQHHPTSSNSIQPHPTSSNIIQHHPTPSNPQAGRMAISGSKQAPVPVVLYLCLNITLYEAVPHHSLPADPV